jgi:hypothetical protein
VSIVHVDPQASGLPAMLGQMIEQNLERDPGRRRLLRPALVSIRVPDADVSASLRIRPGAVDVRRGLDPDSQVVIRADADRVLALTAVPLRFGFPDVVRREGRAIVRDLLQGRIRVRGLVRHPVRVARLSMLLSVADPRGG